MHRKRVVVTGMGAITPVGLDISSVWSNLVAGRSGIRPITLFDASQHGVKIAGEAHGFDPLDFMPKKEARRVDRFTQFALAALLEAQDQAKLNVADHDPYQIGVIVGSGVGGIWTYTQELDTLRNKGPRRVSPFLVPMITVDVPSVQIALRVGAQGPNMGLASACATGSDAIGQAYETICRGHAQAMFTGGFEAAITPIGVATFDRMRALSRRNDKPEAASRPFDVDRDGFVLSEGGAMLILEELEFALSRGVEPLAEVVAYAATSDAAHITAPHSEGAGAARCMTLAIQRAGVDPAGVSYINAHGTSTQVGDPAEVRAIKQSLGERAYQVPISSTKSTTGHLVGGAGALEAVVCVQALRTGIIPPTINLDNPDPAFDLDLVPHTARRADLDLALTNSFGFGGHNTTLAIRSYQ